MAKIAIIILLFILTKLQLAFATCRPDWIGDGFCDLGCNTQRYHYDDGDCCEDTCKSEDKLFRCGYYGYDCQTAPAWFTQSTSLCYKWRADGNRGQCGRGVPNELCAGVGNLTTSYNDDTDGRGGGCRMQWSIR